MFVSVVFRVKLPWQSGWVRGQKEDRLNGESLRPRSHVCIYSTNEFLVMIGFCTHCCHLSNMKLQAFSLYSPCKIFHVFQVLYLL